MGMQGERVGRITGDVETPRWGVSLLIRLMPVSNVDPSQMFQLLRYERLVS